jgi:hypothetical protein
VRFGELAVAGTPNPDSRRLGSFLDASPGGWPIPRLENAWECDPGVGLPGAEALERAGDSGIPEAASVSKNSTHSLENDYERASKERKKKKINTDTTP